MRSPASQKRAVRIETGENPLREAFIKRATETISRLAAQAEPKLLADALATATGEGAIAHVLAESPAAAVVELDPLAPLVARNAEHRAQALAAAGGVFSSTEVAERLGVSRQAVEKRRRSGALLAVRIAGDWRYPRCQFDATTGETVKGLPEWLRALAASNPWVILDVLLTPDETLGGEAPLHVLRRDGMTPALSRLALIRQGDGFG